MNQSTTSLPKDTAGQLELPNMSARVKTWDEYAKWVEEATDPNAKVYPIVYSLSGLATEGGECGAFVEKFLRRGGDWGYIDSNVSKVILEAGDILYYLTKLCNDLGITLNDVMTSNVQKLEDRKVNGKR